MKKILATLVTAAVIGAGGMAVASATASPSSSSSSSATTTTKAGHAGLRAKARRFAFKTAADTIGISPADLLTAMKGNHSIADVAAAHHVDRQTVIDAVVRALDARIDTAVTNGRITSVQAAKLKAVVATRVPKLVDATPRQIRRHRIVAGAIDVSAKTIGVTPAALKQAVVGGQSVAQVATARGVDPTSVVGALVAAGDKRIDAAVANHRLDAARAATLKARLPQLAQRFVDFTRAAAAAA
jgi:uncharacterized protein YidB (DUF937 family)